MHSGLRDIQDMIIIFLFEDIFEHGLLKCLIVLVLEGDHKFSKTGLAMGVTFEGDDANIGNNTHSFVIVHEKIGLHDLTNLTQLEKDKYPGTMCEKCSCLIHIFMIIYTRIILLPSH